MLYLRSDRRPDVVLGRLHSARLARIDNTNVQRFYSVQAPKISVLLPQGMVTAVTGRAGCLLLRVDYGGTVCLHFEANARILGSIGQTANKTSAPDAAHGLPEKDCNPRPPEDLDEEFGNSLR